ncbi:MAG: hypothetical protein WCO52_05440 [bacterium]
MKHMEVQNYGFNLILKDYARFPRYLPLPCHLEHGWTSLEEALVSDLKTEQPLMLTFSKRRKEAWKRKSPIPAEVMGAPFSHYKDMQGIVRDKAARGTVVFPSHSTYDLKAQFDIDLFCKELQSLPKEFQPITVCLFWIDYIDKKADVYRKAGFSVVTTGSKFVNSISFPRNFYSILSQHKYCASNDVGSYTFYSVDFGTPFFLVGEPAIVINKGMKDVNIGAVGRIEDTDLGLKVHNLFSTGPVSQISAAQKKFVEDEMGTKDCLSREEMHDLLWKYYRKNPGRIKDSLAYMADTAIKTFILNGPLGKLAIAIRTKIS